jgi:hypothetical protein
MKPKVHMIVVKDSILGIFNALDELGQLIQKEKDKYPIVIDYSGLRQRGTQVSNGVGVSSGPVPFIIPFDTLVEQLDKKKVKKIYYSLDLSHPDFIEFLNAQDKLKLVNIQPVFYNFGSGRSKITTETSLAIYDEMKRIDYNGYVMDDIPDGVQIIPWKECDTFRLWAHMDKQEKEKEEAQVKIIETVVTNPRKSEKVSRSSTLKLKSGCGSIFITVTYDKNNVPYDVYLTKGKGGQCLKSWCEALGKSISIGLHYHVPISYYIDTLKGIRCPSPLVAANEDNSVWSCSDAISKALEELTQNL